MENGSPKPVEWSRGGLKDLIAAREQLQAEVESLRQKKAQLEAEIAEGTASLSDQADSVHREKTLRAIFDAAPDAMVVLRLMRSGPDDDALPAGRFVEINRGFEKLLGYTREEVLGRTVGELNLWGDAEERARLIQKLLEHGGIENLETQLTNREGVGIPCLLSVSTVELRGERYVVAIARNVSDLKEAETRLQRSEETFRTLFDANVDSMTIVDLQTGKFVDVNQEFVRNSGISREEIIGTRSRDFNQWVNPEDSMRLADGLRKNGQVRNMEVVYRRRDGRLEPNLLSATLLQLNGHVCCLTITRNITALKDTERQLIEAREAALAASRAKSEFLSSMSHEIRTPLNAVLGMADLLAETRLDADQHKYLNVMINNGNALLALINDILDLAKVEAGRVELERSPFDLSDLIDRVSETFAVRAHAKRLELAGHVVPEVPARLIGDPLRVRQVLINLLGNAIKFTEQGSIVVTVEPEAAADGFATLHFSVADTGVGIAPDQIGKIFGTFTQADSSTTRKYGGSGLGLAIVKRLVELMGGKVWVESEVGRGSTFHFTARFEMQTGEAASAEETAPPVSLAGVRTLVVDDTPVNRIILREMLGARGAVVTEAANGEAAISHFRAALLAKKPFELLVLDCRMPQMDGIEVARRIKASKPCRVVTLMLTSDDFNIKTPQMDELGIHAYMVKPIRRTELYEAIAGAMAKVNGTQAAPAGPEQARDAAPAAATAGPRSWRILLAEDSPDNRMLIEAYLKSTPHRLETADNGEIAVRKFMANRHDLILMDMQMPVMDGYEAVRRIRRDENERKLGRTPIIALTASALKEDQERSLNCGCDLHLPKPVKKATLLAEIEKLMEKAGNGAKADSKEPVHQLPVPAGVGFFAAHHSD